jgi:hypothetical protein
MHCSGIKVPKYSNGNIGILIKSFQAFALEESDRQTCSELNLVKVSNSRRALVEPLQIFSTTADPSGHSFI